MLFCVVTVEERNCSVIMLSNALIQFKAQPQGDYRNLMNTNLSTFQPIKWETVRYTFRIPALSKESTSIVYNENTKVLKLINGVKDKSRQISLTLGLSCEILIGQYAAFFAGIYKFHLVAKVSFNFFAPFSSYTFENIHHVVLENMLGISTFRAPLRMS
jgi:hypothetical protein